MLRAQKIKYITTQLELVSDEDLLKIERTIDDAHKYGKMYNALLIVLNKILEHNEMEQITDITKFNIMYTRLMTNDCYQIMLNNLVELSNSNLDPESNANLDPESNSYLDIIKCVCTQLGYTLSMTLQKNHLKKDTFSTYYIIKKNI